MIFFHLAIAQGQVFSLAPEAFFLSGFLIGCLEQFPLFLPVADTLTLLSLFPWPPFPVIDGMGECFMLLFLCDCMLLLRKLVESNSVMLSPKH